MGPLIRNPKSAMRNLPSLLMDFAGLIRQLPWGPGFKTLGYGRAKSSRTPNPKGFAHI